MSLSWSDIRELVDPIVNSLIEVSYWLSWSHLFKSFTIYVCHKWQWICSVYCSHNPTLSSSPVFSEVRVAKFFVFCVMFCRSFFCPFFCHCIVCSTSLCFVEGKLESLKCLLLILICRVNIDKAVLKPYCHYPCVISR